MKTLFIEARSSKQIKLPEALIKSLPGKVGLTTTVQFLGSLDSMRKQLEAAGKKVSLIKSARSVYEGQTLGCIAVEKLDKLSKTDAILYVGNGTFHPVGIAIAFNNTKDIFAYNPDSEKFSKVDKSIVEKVQKHKKGNLSKFYASDNIGIILTTKPGQKIIQRSNGKLLEKKYPKKDFYYFISDNLNLAELENFQFIGCWINTACPMIVYEYYFEEIAGKRASIINIDDVE